MTYTSTYPIPLPPVTADHTCDCPCVDCRNTRRSHHAAPPAPPAPRPSNRGTPWFLPKSADEDWKADAACRPLDPDVFFPPRGDVRAFAAAKAVCVGCPVRRDCLIHAISKPVQRDGIWGGMTGKERRNLTVDNLPAVLPPVQINGAEVVR